MSVQIDINIWETCTVTAHANLQNSYPVQLRIKGRQALVVGAGNIAVRKIQGLLRAGADVTVIAPWIHPLISALPVDIVERTYLDGEAGNYQLVITCTDDRLVNRQVFRDADAAGVWVNSADDPVNCSFILPAVARQGDLTLTISTNGKSPAMATWLRRKFEAESLSSLHGSIPSSLRCPLTLSNAHISMAKRVTTNWSSPAPMTGL